ncbi:MAG: MaoC family dehydratase, partial [Terriglobia bacterium]
MTEKRFEELGEGEIVRCSHEISAEEEDAFIKLSGDMNPLHIDEDFAQSNGFDGRLAHGLLISSLLLRTFGMVSGCPGFLCLSQTTRFLKPVYIGDRIELIAKVVQKSESLRVLVLETTVFNQKREKVLTGEAKVMM